ncbi:MAG: pyridoxamine 5-phosphate oxidase [Nitrospinae bacterium]|nr:pyridoxamine 5-phosphate oxidase [Nitrospinota bacterium]MZH14276.1 pyridoxamine 5-phosphate oxidase [Nitrospinota bacterium]
MVERRQKGEHELQKKYNTRKSANSFYNTQVLNFLNSEMQKFISEQEMVFISTADAKGECDASFRAGPKSFVKVLDNNTIIFPEFKGNGVMASMGNIIENPNIGLMFIDFFDSSIGLHVNGKAEIITEHQAGKLVNPIDKAKAEKDGQHKTKLWIKIEVEEAFIHCSKHIPKLQKMDKVLHWGTDDEKLKGGDFFNTRECKS